VSARACATAFAGRVCLTGLSSNETEKFNLDSRRNPPDVRGSRFSRVLTDRHGKCFPPSSSERHINPVRDKNSGTGVTPDRISCSRAPPAADR